MNKSQLIRALAERRSISLEEASTIVNTFFDGIKETLLQDKRVEIRGFGSFKMKHYEGYQGRNPSTGEIVQVQPKRLPFFRVGKELKEYLNE
jgi:integration host factor subunit beta